LNDADKWANIAIKKISNKDTMIEKDVTPVPDTYTRLESPRVPKTQKHDDLTELDKPQQKIDIRTPLHTQVPVRDVLPPVVQRTFNVPTVLAILDEFQNKLTRREDVIATAKLLALARFDVKTGAPERLVHTFMQFLEGARSMVQKLTVSESLQVGWRPLLERYLK
jgi:hypothetical protein